MGRPDEPGGQPERDDVPRGPRIDDIRAYRGSFIGIAGLACVPFLVWGAHDVYGTAVSVLLTLWWLFLLSVAIVWFTPFPARMPWLALVGLGSWLAVVLVAHG